MSVYNLKTHVKSATWTQNKAEELKKQDDDRHENLLKKSHPVLLVFRNITDFPLSKTGEYFDTGDWFGTVTDVAPWTASGIAAADKMAGCTGGASFKLHLDTDIDFDFSIGFTNPVGGSNKMCCIEGKDAKDAYRKANDDDKKDKTFTSSDHYIATTATAKTLHFRFQVSVSHLSPLGKDDDRKIYVNVQQVPY
ncbi:hypothetical protein KCU78_g576, partial [Aureobasidium melanogenum]